VALEEEQARGLGHTGDGAVFLFEQANGCHGLRFVAQDMLAYEGCPARVLDNKVFEEQSALVDDVSPEASPTYFEEVSEYASETALGRGRELFEKGEYAAAASAFKEAANEVDPFAPYEETDIRYNRARCLEAQGKLREALALFESIGDVAYQDVVDEKIRALGGGIR
jgi:tetratricopeptide (TPR) repeat protein